MSLAGSVLARIASWLGALIVGGVVIALSEKLAALGFATLPPFQWWGFQAIQWVNAWLPLDNLVAAAAAIYASRMILARTRFGLSQGGRA